MNGGKINDNQWIDKKYVQQFGQPKGTNSVKNGLNNGYSNGMYMRDRYGVKGLYGLGSIIGFRGVTYIFKEQKKAFFIAYNMDSEVANYERFNQLMVDSLFITKRPLPKKGKPIPVNLFDDFKGYFVPIVTKYEPYGFTDILTGFTEIKAENDHLLLLPFQQKEKKLFYQKANIFWGEDRTEASHAVYKNGNDLYYTDGLKTGKKVSGWYIFLLWLSTFFGLVGMLIILLSGFYQLFKQGKGIAKLPIFWAFLGILSLLVPIPFFMAQPFVEMANRSEASISLFLATILFPLGIFIFIYQIAKNKNQWKPIYFSVFFAAQFIIVLVFWGLLPLKLWS